MEEITVRPPKWKAYAMLTVMLTFLLLILFILYKIASTLGFIIGAFALIFLVGLRARDLFSTSLKGGGYISLTKESLNINSPEFDDISIKWKDIDEFDVYKMRLQNLTTIRLGTYDNVIKAISPEDSEKFLKRINLFADAGAINSEDNSRLINEMPSSPGLKGFVDYLTYSRSKYGGEFFIGWNLRDRTAQELAEYLREKKKEYTLNET